jgi:hypothetical protein
MNHLTDTTVTFEIDMRELEALLKTVGIAINNLLGKCARLDPLTTLHGTTNDELLTLVGVQQALMELLVENSADPS